MRPVLDDIPDTLARVIALYIEHGCEAAVGELATIAPKPVEGLKPTRNAPVLFPPILDKAQSALKRPNSTPLERVTTYRRDDGWLCRYCGKRTVFEPIFHILGPIFPAQLPYHRNWKSGLIHEGVKAHFASPDHVVPGARGGSWADPDNLVTTCAECNYGKSDRLLQELGWTLRPRPETTGWDGLIGFYPALWEVAGRPSSRFHKSWLNALEQTMV
jgi:HNH endonuclease